MPVQDDFPDYVRDQRGIFDRMVAEDWDDYVSESWNRSRAFEIAKIFERIQPKSVLNIGCGVGYHDLLIAAYPWVRSVRGIDYSPASIAKAEVEYPHVKVVREVSDFDSFRMEGGFEAIVSFQVVEHLDDLGSFFACARENVASGGYLVIATPNRRRLRNRLRRLAGKDPELLDPLHFREFSRVELDDVARQNGWLPQWMFGYDLHAPVISRLPGMLRLQLGYYMPHLAHIFVACYKMNDQT